MRHLTVISRRAFERRLILAAAAQGTSDILQRPREGEGAGTRWQAVCKPAQHVSTERGQKADGRRKDGEM
jgi:hypothetical protein